MSFATWNVSGKQVTQAELTRIARVISIRLLSEDFDKGFKTYSLPPEVVAGGAYRYVCERLDAAMVAAEYQLKRGELQPTPGDHLALGAPLPAFRLAI